MLYLAIDQHRKQLTVNLRNEQGDVLEKRQVSTQWPRVREYFAALQRRSMPEGGFVAIVEVCGFNDWLLKLLREYSGHEPVLIQPEQRSKKKTDHRDAQQLGELLWVNRQRLRDGQQVQGLRRVVPPTAEDAADRQLTALRHRLGQQRTRTINSVQHLLLKHNLQQECPTKGLQTRTARRWLASLELPAIDRLEMDQLLAQWDLWESQLQTVEEHIAVRQKQHSTASIVATMPGAAAFGSLALAASIGDIERFPRPESLPNYWGITPSCRNSGDAQQRLGSITKQGSKLARFILGQMVMHVLRRDPYMKAWYQRIKKRRGSKIARVAVMRRMATILWHMLKYRQPYRSGGPPEVRKMQAALAFTTSS